MKNAIVQQMAVAPHNRDIQWIKTSLQAAIELELSTLPPYLCAMWSIRDSTVEPGKGAYTLIDSIVRQEMGHMGLVCNMLAGIGGAPQIAAGFAENIKYPCKLPGGVRQELIVSLSGLTKPYVHDVLMQIEFPENEVVIESVVVDTFPTIGAFYDALADAFDKNAVTLDPSKQLVSAFGVKKLATLQDVKDAITLIQVQGEGSSTNPGDGGSNDEMAHYYRFAELYVGKTITKTAGGGFAFAGTPVPFPDTITVPPIPEDGFPNAPSAVTGLLGVFNSLFSGMLDDLDAAWKNANQALLTAAVLKMRQLRGASNSIMAKALPKGVDGFYGPTFEYIPANQRTVAPADGSPGVPAGRPSTAAPKFSDITTLLATLAGGDPNIDAAPHGAFWTNDYDTFMATKTDDWGVAGNLVVKGDPAKSVLLQVLSGPVGGLPQMPDTDADPNGRHATAAELQMVSTWITNNCPK